ncbi:MAG TPA: inositol monophosphatase family protein [Actinomycetota bacterium]|nr:inositol monophosphatase family protein [Actinomycetota bacterium]
MSELRALATRAAREAGALLLERFRGPIAGLDTKSSPTDLVSDADRDSEELLLDLIARERPDDGIVSEEGGDERSRSGLEWVVDPLDGTVNYLYRIPWWAVSIAVEDDKGAVVGVVFDPVRDALYEAERGEGAWLNSRCIRVSDTADFSGALIGTGFSYEAEAREVQAATVARVLPLARDIRRAGSAALDLAALAAGHLDGFYEAPMERWDKAAGILLVEEAGGIVTELPPPLPHLSPGVIAANAELHRALNDLVLGD